MVVEIGGSWRAGNRGTAKDDEKILHSWLRK